MIVTWVTQDNSDGSFVEYGSHSAGAGMDRVAKGEAILFEDGGSEKRKFFIHKVLLTGLIPNTFYVYHVGSDTGRWSDIFFFTSMKEGQDWSPTFAVVGDMGTINGKSISSLQKEVQKSLFDAVLHVGDFAYDMDVDNSRVGDDYMRQVQSFAAYVPYMTSPGNHENAYNFSNYKSRFTMPNKYGGDGNAMFYSFDVGPVHLVSFSSEFYYYVSYGWTQIVEQYKWLIRDLQEANKPSNRAKRPWIISMCHRPMYCSNSNDPEHCPNLENMIRVGLPMNHEYNIEDLLYKYGVDLHFQAHEHSYERMWPVYNLTVCNGSAERPYVNPRAPVHIVSGSGGCKEGVDPFIKIPYPWSAFQSDDYGYTVMKILNKTHLSLDQVSVDKGGAIIDSVMIEKQKHGPSTFDCHKNLKFQYKSGGIKSSNKYFL
ncbi:hypothetical protein HELRODRAFT_62767 [Helobdella robusta]|uniref:Purple acid phosphatase n=1 Tax=Helobdella robusta TaxID=6412 RepID=T1FX50_HELRO|nr:hypothetical protein HELRODRAFT_62767 [Helobdella robusta]ESO12513.1 hypothetical protein HELRODRAFT_62767 [Helobdella robusta]